MNIRCPYCGVEYELDSRTYGRKANCGSCGKDFIIGQTPVWENANRTTRRRSRPRLDRAAPESKKRLSMLDVLTHVMTSVSLLFRVLIGGAVSFVCLLACLKIASCIWTVKNDIARQEAVIAARPPVTKLFGVELGSRMEPDPDKADKIHEHQKEVAISKPFFGTSSVGVWLTPISHRVYKIGFDAMYMVVGHKFNDDLFRVPTQEAIVQALMEKYGENDSSSDVTYKHHAGETELVFSAAMYDYRERTAKHPELRDCDWYRVMVINECTYVHDVRVYLIDHALERVFERECEELEKRDVQLRKKKAKEAAASMRDRLPL